MNRKNLVITGFLAASAAFFGIAYAQGPGCDGDGKPGMKRSSMHGGMSDPATRVDQRLSRMKDELKITAQQEPLWQAFAEKSKAEAGKGMQAMRDKAKDDKGVTAPERMTQMQTIMKERVAAMESVNESFKRLYASLTPEQKAAADKQFSRAGQHDRGPGHGHDHGDGPREQRKG